MDPIAPTDPANAEYARPCPTCRALPGQPCTYVGEARNGSVMHDSHAKRREERPDDLTEECWTGDHDRCSGYTKPESDPSLCECPHHDDDAAAYLAGR